MEQSTAFYQAQYETLAKALPGQANPKIKQCRQQALASLVKTGFPSRHEERWKYTRIDSLLKRAFQHVAEQTLTDSAIKHTAMVAHYAANLIFVDGRFSPEMSDIPTQSGLSVRPLLDVFNADDVDAAEALLLKQGDAYQKADAFQALNAALVSSGTVIDVAKNAVIEKPICLTYLTTSNESNGHACHIRNVIRLQSHASVSVIEHYTGDADALGLSNCVTQATLEDGARLTHYKLQNEALKKYHIGHIQVEQARHSYFKSFSLALGGALSKTDITVNQNGTGCDTVLDGLFIGKKRQHMDHHTCVEHRHPHGTSDECYRGVMDDASKGVFNGRVVVHPGAMKTDASQSNKNLLLSSKAEIDTKPELEIYADDVKCAHGATVGQLDAARLFYLQSRGIDEATAHILLIFAFIEDVVKRIDNKELRHQLELMIIERLPSGDVLRDALMI